MQQDTGLLVPMYRGLSVARTRMAPAISLLYPDGRAR
jgi:hypothetical protein